MGRQAYVGLKIPSGTITLGRGRSRRYYRRSVQFRGPVGWLHIRSRRRNRRSRAFLNPIKALQVIRALGLQNGRNVRLWVLSFVGFLMLIAL